MTVLGGDLGGKVAVVTGAASGIGFALASRCAHEGMRVVLADIEPGPLADAAAAISGTGVETLSVVTDVAVEDSVNDLAARTFDRFGTAHLICNNAGVGTYGTTAWGTSRSAWEWVLGVNLWGVIHGIRAFVPRLVEQNEGYVVNTSSAAGLVGLPTLAPYVASKHAVVGISESLFHEFAALGSDVGVSVVCPGLVDTRIYEAGRNWPSSKGAPPVPDSDPRVQSIAEHLAPENPTVVSPAFVADLVLDAVRTRRFLVLTEPSLGEQATASRSAEVRGDDPRGLG